MAKEDNKASMKEFNEIKKAIASMEKVITDMEKEDSGADEKTLDALYEQLDLLYQDRKEYISTMGAVSSSFNVAATIFKKTTGLFKTIVKDTASVFTKVISSLKNTVSDIAKDVLGEFKSEILDPITGLLGSLWNSLFKEDDEQLGVLKLISGYSKNMSDYFNEQLKRQGRETKDKENMSFGEMLVVGLGLAVGAFIGMFVKPLAALLNMLVGTGKIIKWALSKIPGMVKVFNWMGNLFSSVGKSLSPVMRTLQSGVTIIKKSFSPLVKGVQFLATKMPGVAHMFGLFKAGIMTGFKFLGWPLTILMAIIDFIRTFIKTEGDIVTRVTTALHSAIVGIFEMPLRILGWLVEKFASVFGIQITGLGDFLATSFSNLVAGILNLITSSFSWVKEKMSGGVSNLFSSIWDAIFGIVKDIGTWLTENINVKKLLSSAWSGLKSGYNNTVNFFSKDESSAIAKQEESLPPATVETIKKIDEQKKIEINKVKEVPLISNELPSMSEIAEDKEKEIEVLTPEEGAKYLAEAAAHLERVVEILSRGQGAGTTRGTSGKIPEDVDNLGLSLNRGLLEPAY
jgi:hypothetical protein